MQFFKGFWLKFQCRPNVFRDTSHFAACSPQRNASRPCAETRPVRRMKRAVGTCSANLFVSARRDVTGLSVRTSFLCAQAASALLVSI